MMYLLFVLGLAFLVGGGELLVNSGVKLAKKLHLPPLVIGVVLMGCGTSLPELSASITALSNGVPGMAFGSIIGSNISNILFILGLSALLSPVRIGWSGFRRDGLFLLMSAFMMGLIMWFGYLDTVIGIFFILFILGYFVICYDKEPEPEDLHLTRRKEISVLLYIALSILGIATIIYGADLLIASATKIARIWGVNESVLGLTLIAFGTSLPELTVSIVAAIHKHTSVAYGNIIGSNIANIFLIMGAMGLIYPTPVTPLWSSFWIMVAATIAIIICGVFGKIPRWVGALFLVGYIGYVCLLF